MVNRSALVLKLLTFAPTGAIVAAPTCGFPKRSAACATGITGTPGSATRRSPCTPSAAGLHEEAEQFMGWLEAALRRGARRGPLQIMYGIDGRHELPEETLDHLEGYTRLAARCASATALASSSSSTSTAN